jgi:hypothetical protein
MNFIGSLVRHLLSIKYFDESQCRSSSPFFENPREVKVALLIVAIGSKYSFL